MNHPISSARLVEAQGESSHPAKIRARRERGQDAGRDCRELEHIPGDGPEIRSQGSHEAQASYPGRLSAAVYGLRSLPDLITPYT